MGAKNVWLNPPLERLKEKIDKENKGKKAGRGGGFSAKLGDIVERYDAIMALTKAPELSDAEIYILSEVLCGSVIDVNLVERMHIGIMDCASGTDGERKVLSERVESWTSAERVALIEALGL